MPPIYEFKCHKCEKIHEEYRSIDRRFDAPYCCGELTARHYSGRHQIMPDIEPYRTVAADKETGERVHIGSRKQHREFLKRNGYEEIGNEKMPFTRRRSDA